MTVPKADLKGGGRRRPQAAAGRRLARDIVAEVDASTHGTPVVLSVRRAGAEEMGVATRPLAVAMRSVSDET